MIQSLLILATALQVVAVAYGTVLLGRRRGAAGAWLFLLGAMLSMLAWRIFVMTGAAPPPSFNALIAIWGSTCMLVAMLLFAREVERRERAEAERDDLLASERAARTEAERAARLKDDFLATLSHELRTPLTAILGWCSILRLNRVAAADLPRAVETIERNARAQVRLVDELLDATRIQAGTLHLDRAPLCLDVPVRAALDGVGPAIDAKELRLDFRLDGEVPIVHGDTGRLQQIASNLVMNAIKFTPPGGRITVRLATRGDRAELVVSDTGEGLAPAFVPHLFTRFRQADGTVGRRHGGLGLGLSIVQSLARLHGGEVSASSGGPGQGATFTVTLPLADVRAPATANPLDGRIGDVPSVAGGLGGMRVLVVDDEPDVRTVVSTLLRQAGAQVLALESGEAIQDSLERLRPHVLLIDIGMPGEDGYSLIRRIRQLPASLGGSVPAVSLTAHARNEDRARAMASGFQEHLPKPVDVPLLITTVRRLAAMAPAA